MVLPGVGRSLVRRRAQDQEKRSAPQVSNALRRHRLLGRASRVQPDLRRDQAAPADGQGRAEGHATAVRVRSRQLALAERLRQRLVRDAHRA